MSIGSTEPFEPDPAESDPAESDARPQGWPDRNDHTRSDPDSKHDASKDEPRKDDARDGDELEADEVDGDELDGDRAAEPAEGAGPLDVDAAFAALVAGWNVDTTHALIEAERELSRENPQWRAEVPEPTYWPEDHYEPPAPPPFPRLHPRTVLAMSLLAISVSFIVLGTDAGFAFAFCLTVGVLGIIGATILFMSRLRSTNDEDDDGAHV
jgi:hypothetical protein